MSQVVGRLLEIGLVQDKRELHKKRKKKNRQEDNGDEEDDENLVVSEIDLFCSCQNLCSILNQHDQSRNHFIPLQNNNIHLKL